MCRRTAACGAMLFGIGIGLIVSVFLAAGAWCLLLGFALVLTGFLIGRK